ncbi:MAG: hypothetical protein RLZZ524_774 [Pseudomonadota bacterium]|jgi:CRP/FNR family transcriptional regulator, dissimilatory nitrate respiration regulator
MSHPNLHRKGPTVSVALQSLIDDHQRSYEAGAAVFRAGAPARHVYHLTEGRVRLVRYGRAGEEAVIHVARPGEFFAEASLHGDRYHCTAVAVVPSTLAAIPSAGLAALLAEDPGVMQAWVAILSSQLRRARSRVERLCLRSAAERIEHLLLCEGSGPACIYRPGGSLKELAVDLGLTHEALYRTLANMVRDGRLVRDGQQLSLPTA